MFVEQYTKEQIASFLQHYQGKAPIVGYYRGYVVMAENRVDYRSKLAKIDRKGKKVGIAVETISQI